MRSAVPVHAALSRPAGRRLVAALLLAVAAAIAARAEKLVIVRSTADSEYVSRRTIDGRKRLETYVFLPGRYFAGLTYDTALQQTTFPAVARAIAQHLQAQNFRPAKEAAKADLLLVVHWGVTDKVETDYDLGLRDPDQARQLMERYQEEKQYVEDAAVAGDYLPTVNNALGDLEQRYATEVAGIASSQSAGQAKSGNNAELLGFADTLRREENSILLSERYRTLVSMTKEERYFLIVMAYDMPLLIGTGKMKRLWTARLSIRAAGVNFPQAVGRMSLAAADYFGTRQADVVLARATDRKASVEIGEVTVIGTTDELPARRLSR